MDQYAPSLAHIFEQKAAALACRVPSFLGEQLFLNFNRLGHWYSNNGYYKFPVGEKIDCRGPEYFGYGPDPRGWTVVGHDHDDLLGDRYLIQTAKGEVQTHFKWNLEFQFKKADAELDPFDPDRFSPPFN